MGYVETPRSSRTNHTSDGPAYPELNATFDLIAVPGTWQAVKPRILILHTTNMWVLPALGYVGVILGFAFLTLAIGKPSDSLRHLNSRDRLY